MLPTLVDASSSDAQPTKRECDTLRFVTPSVGRVLARGAGHGAALGAAFGVLLIPVAGLLPGGSDEMDLVPIAYLTIALAPLTALFGALYGVVAGLAAAGALLAVPTTRRTALVARATASLAAALVVAVISRLLFEPSLDVGGNETTDHVVERLVLFYAFPCASALLAGAIAGHRIVAPAPDEALPTAMSIT